MKHDKSYTINLDKETAQMLERLAQHRQRKTRELLRLILEPVILEQFLALQCELFPENNEPIKPAFFKPSKED